jgi:hypothetical protein
MLLRAGEKQLTLREFVDGACSVVVTAEAPDNLYVQYQHGNLVLTDSKQVHGGEVLKSFQSRWHRVPANTMVTVWAENRGQSDANAWAGLSGG